MHEVPRPNIQNRILASLSDEEFERLAPHLEHASLPLGKVINRSNESTPYAYFPHTAMISIVSNQANGATVEVGVVGNEGMTGIHALFGAETTPNESMVQIADGGTRIKIEALRAEFKRGGMLQDLLLRYAHALMIQIGQTAACNRLHTTEERLARWLLMSHDRAASDELGLTHEFIAMMLGTRRAGVTGAAIALQTEGFISYKRGHITILDRQGLEDFSCECYGIVKAEFDSLHAAGRGGGERPGDEKHLTHV